MTVVEFEGHALTIHKTDAWVDPRYPVIGPPMTWEDNDTHAIHYTAAINLIDGDLGEFAYNIPPYLRAIHRDYLTNRPQYRDGALISPGYSIGYNHAVDWLGGIWTLRGWDFACAANRGWNHRTWATLCLVDGSDPLTAEALRSVRYLHREGERRAAKFCHQRPHSQLRSDGTLMAWPGSVSGCPGDGIRSQILRGLTNHRSSITPTPPPLPPVPPVPTPEEITMFTAVIKGTTADRHAVLLTVNGASVGMTGLTTPSDERAMLAALGQASTIAVSNSLWDDWKSKAVASAQR